MTICLFQYYVLLRSTKENAYYLCTVHEVVTVLYGMRFHGLDRFGRHLGPAWPTSSPGLFPFFKGKALGTRLRPGTFCLDLMCSVFLTRKLVSILWHSFTDETLAIFCLLQDCLKFFSRFSINFFLYCWFSHDVTKKSNWKTIDPTEILLSRYIRAAEN